MEYNIYDQNQSVVATAPGKLFPNVKGCGYPPIVDCDGNNVSRVVVTCSHVQTRAVTCVHVLLTLVTWPDFVETFGRPGHNFTCFYSAVAADLVITRLDYAEITRTLLLRWGTRVTPCHV